MCTLFIEFMKKNINLKTSQEYIGIKPNNILLKTREL